MIGSVIRSGGKKAPHSRLLHYLAACYFLRKKGSAYFSGKEVNPMHEPTTRRALTGAIVKLLAAADFRQLRLVWVYASHLIG